MMPSLHLTQERLSSRSPSDAMVCRNHAHDELPELLAAMEEAPAAGRVLEIMMEMVHERLTDYWRAQRDLCRAYDKCGTVVRDAKRGDRLPCGRTVTVCFAKRVGRWGEPNSMRWTVKLSDGTYLREPPAVDTGEQNWAESPRRKGARVWPE